MIHPEIGHSRLLRLGLPAIVLAAFVGFGWVVVPKALRDSYEGRGATVVGRLFAELQRRNPRPLERYLFNWAEVRRLVLGLGASLWLMSTAGARRVSARFSRRFVVPCTPGTLGAIRCLVFGTLLFSVAVEDLSSVALLPLDFRSRMGFLHAFDLLPARSFDAFHQAPMALMVFQAATAVLLVAAVLGLMTRLVVPLAAACYFVFGGILREYSHFFHPYLLSLYLAVALAFMPCGDGWSVDRLIRLARGRAVHDRDAPAEIYGWCRMICWTLIAVTYTLAGMSKLSKGGLGWISADTIRDAQMSDSLNPSTLDFVPDGWGLGLLSLDTPDFLLSGLAGTVLVGEVSFLLVLISRDARRALPALMAGMHLGILLCQRLFFLDSILLQGIFWDWRATRLRVGRWIARGRGPLRVALGPTSGPGIEAFLRELDLFERIQFVDARDVEVAPAGPFPLASSSDGRVDFGPSAARRIAACLPLTWPFSFLAGHRWTLALASRAWSAAAGRGGVGGHPGPCLPERHTPETAFFPAMISCLVIFVINWANSREIYPISCWGMYSGANTDGKTHYLKVLAHYEDGRIEPAPIGRWIGVMHQGRFKVHIANLVGEDRRAGRQKLARFLDVCMSAANATAPPGRRVVGIEAQSWDWSLHDPGDRSTKGRMVERHYQPAPH